MSDLTEQAHLAAPCDMAAEYIAQLTHELYTRTFMYPDSKSLHDRAMEIKAEVTKRLLDRDQLRAEVERLREELQAARKAMEIAKAYIVERKPPFFAYKQSQRECEDALASLNAELEKK